MTLAQRRRFADSMPQVLEGPPPDAAWDLALNHNGWNGLQLIQQHDFELFEQLPRGVRYAMQEAVFVWETMSLYRQIMPALDSGMHELEVVTIVSEAIRKKDLEDVRQEAATYRWRYGEPYPHLAAKATFVRYDEASLHGRAPALAPPFALREEFKMRSLQQVPTERPAPSKIRPTASKKSKKRRSVDSAFMPKMSRQRRKRRE